jgi:hypothetical protein
MEEHMLLPTLKNSVPASLDGQSVEDFIRNSIANLQRTAAAMPGSGIPGVVYLGFNGNTGEWKLNKEMVDPKSLGRILVPQHGLFEDYKEWANGSVLQKAGARQLLGVHYDQPMSEHLLREPLSPHAYRKDTDGPTYMIGFIGFMLDDGANVMFEHRSGGAKKAVNALATAATQAVAAFGEIIHPVIDLGSGFYEIDRRKIYEPKLNVVGYVTDARAREAKVITDSDIITRPTASAARLRRETKEAPAL